MVKHCCGKIRKKQNFTNFEKIRKTLSIKLTEFYDLSQTIQHETAQTEVKVRFANFHFSGFSGSNEIVAMAPKKNYEMKISRNHYLETAYNTV